MISAAQRFRRGFPCIVCGGWDQMRRHQGTRCAGFISDDGAWAHCTRPEFAGSIAASSANPPTYAHRLEGACHCGRDHGGAITPIPQVPAPLERPHFPGHEREQLGSIECTYVYRNEQGVPVHRTVRYKDPKSFRQQRREGSGWRWGLGPISPLLYRLPELLAAPPDTPVFLPEGEKDCDQLAALGLVATTNPMGATTWQPHYTAWLRGRHIVILEDNDTGGRMRTGKLLHELTPVAASIRVVRFPGLGDGADVSDWLDAGGTVEELIGRVGEIHAKDNACLMTG